MALPVMARTKAAVSFLMAEARIYRVTIATTATPRTALSAAFNRVALLDNLLNRSFKVDPIALGVPLMAPRTARNRIFAGTVARLASLLATSGLRAAKMASSSSCSPLMASIALSAMLSVSLLTKSMLAQTTS